MLQIENSAGQQKRDGLNEKEKKTTEENNSVTLCDSKLNLSHYHIKPIKYS